jgi:uncharacterized damage-inducible protein DinB
VIADVRAFLQWFDGVNRRTIRDIGLLPVEAEAWMPGAAGSDEETGWGVPRLVQHIVEARGYFASAFLGGGWVWDAWPEELTIRETWVPALEASAADLRERLEGLPNERLRERVELLGAPDKKVSAWRLLMMMSEHEIQHRSQIAAYAGLNGWEVAQTFDRTNEWVVAQRDEQIQRYR